MNYFPYHRCPEFTNRRKRAEWDLRVNKAVSRALFTFASSIFRLRIRGSKANGLSLFVGEPPRTYSTIFTPKPPVESRGLQRRKGIGQSSMNLHVNEMFGNYLKMPVIVLSFRRAIMPLLLSCVDHICCSFDQTPWCSFDHIWCSLLPGICNGANGPVFLISDLLSHNFFVCDDVIYKEESIF